MRNKYVLLAGVLILMQGAVWAGGGIVLKIGKNDTLRKWNNSFMAPDSGTNLEFFAGSAPAPNIESGSFDMDNVTDFPHKVQYDYSDALGKSPEINGKNVVLRIWDGPMRRKGSHYGKAAYLASKDAPAKQYDVSSFKTIYYAWEPKNKPVVGSVSESNQRIADSDGVVLKLVWNYAYSEDTSDGKIEKTGYIVKFWKEGEKEPADAIDKKRVFATTSDTFNLPDKDALNNDQPFGTGTYFYKVRAKNWFGNGPWSDVKEWKTLGKIGTGAPFIPVDKEYHFLRAKDGLGINTFAIPWKPLDPADPLAYVDRDQNKPLRTAFDLISRVNAAAKSPVVQTFGYWDHNIQKAVGVIIEYEGANMKSSSENELKAIDLEPGRSYQVYLFKGGASLDVPLHLYNYTQ